MSSLEINTEPSIMIENNEDGMNSELYENSSKTSPSLIFFKTLWKARIREKSKQFFVMYVIGVVISVVLISIDMTSRNTIDEYKNPPYEYDNDPFSYFYIQVMGEKFILSLGPPNSFVQNLSKEKQKDLINSLCLFSYCGILHLHF